MSETEELIISLEKAAVENVLVIPKDLSLLEKLKYRFQSVVRVITKEYINGILNKQLLKINSASTLVTFLLSVYAYFANAFELNDQLIHGMYCFCGIAFVAIFYIAVRNTLPEYFKAVLTIIVHSIILLLNLYLVWTIVLSLLYSFLKGIWIVICGLFNILLSPFRKMQEIYCNVFSCE
ncbi:hypothetical protein GVAV_000510 [Gurleya vavrai]